MTRHGERTARRSNARVDDDDVNRSRRKPSPDPRERQSRALDILRRNVVRDVDELRFRNERQQHSLHFADIAVGGSEIGGEGYDRAHTTMICAPTHRAPESIYSDVGGIKFSRTSVNARLPSTRTGMSRTAWLVLALGVAAGAVIGLGGF